MKTLILVTESYPFDGAREHTFLNPEVKILSSRCDLHIIPATRQGDFCLNIQNVSVVKGFDLNRRRFWLIYYSVLGLFRKEFWMSFAGCISRCYKFRHVLGVVLYYAKACVFRDFLDRYIRFNNLNDAIVSTFWFSYYTLGSGMLKMKLPSLTVVTRAHGHDLYEERWPSFQIPFRRHAISLMDAIFPDSEAGVHYLSSKYPEYRFRYHVGRLGILSHNIHTEASLDGVIRLVSCAYLVSVKRIDRIARALMVLSRRYPSQSVEWTHFGDGPEKPLVESIVSSILSPNIRCYLVGDVSNQDVFSHYANNPVDFYINVSSTEGTPVSVIEAISCGIPSIVSAVGGNSEVVDISNGVLLNVDFSDTELADSIVNSCNDKYSYAKMKERSLIKWRKLYNANVNYAEYFEYIQSLSS